MVLTMSTTAFAAENNNYYTSGVITQLEDDPFLRFYFYNLYELQRMIRNREFMKVDNSKPSNKFIYNSSVIV